MTHNHRRAIPRRSPHFRQAGVLLSRACLPLCLVLILTGCPSGVVQTESGATVAASTVHAQDLVGDALQALQSVHNAAVTAHDARAGQEPADVHAKRRATLQASAAGLRAGWDGLSAWKLGTEGADMAFVVGKVRSALPEMLKAAVSLGVVSQSYADAINAFFGTAATGQTPAALKKQAVVSVLSPAQEIDWRAAVQPVHRNSTVIQPGAYFDGCNWHTPLPFGGESVTSMGCGYSAQLVTAPLTSTLEVRP